MRPSLVAYLQEYFYNTFVLFTILPNMNEWNVHTILTTQEMRYTLWLKTEQFRKIDFKVKLL